MEKNDSTKDNAECTGFRAVITRKADIISSEEKK